MDELSRSPADCTAPPPVVSRADRLRRWLVPAAVLLTALCAMTGNRVDTDLWGHVVYGRELLRDGRLPDTTTWSYVTTNHRWINHENLAEIALAWTVDHFGPLGLSLGKLLLAVIVVGCMAVSSRAAGAGWLATAVVVIAAADAMEFHWHYRPQAITYACFAVMIALLDAVFRLWRGDWRGWRTALRGTPAAVPASAAARLTHLVWLTPLFLVWTNAHGGFAAGVAVLCAYLGLRCCEAWVWWGREALDVMLRIGLFASLAVAATFVNPYGPELHAWLLWDVGAARPEISDWRPFDLLHDPEAWAVWVLLTLTVAGLAGTRRRRDWTRLVILGIVLWQGLAHCRHIVFFAILCGCWLAGDVQSVLDRLTAGLRREWAGRASSASAPRGQWAGPVLLTLWMAVVVAQLAPRLREIPVRRDWYPVSAMQYLLDQDLRGNVLVEFNWAQYAIMCFAEHPQWAGSTRVAVDGRLRTCYPWETIDVFLDFFIGDGGPDVRNRSPQAPPFAAGRALRIGAPDLALLWRGQWHSLQVMEQSRDEWVLLYQDSLAQLWGRRERYDNPASLDYLPASRRQVSDAPQLGAVPWPALPVHSTAAALSIATR